MAGIPIDEVGTFIAPDTVGSTELKDNSVTTPKIVNDAVTTVKIPDNAVTTPKITDGAIDASKTNKTVRRDPYTKNSNETSVVGTTATEVKTFKFSKGAGINNFTDMSIAAELKTSNALHAATLEVFFNAEGTPRATLSSTATAYDVQASTDIDISALANGSHTVSIKLKSADAASTAFNRLMEFFLVHA